MTRQQMTDLSVLPGYSDESLAELGAAQLLELLRRDEEIVERLRGLLEDPRPWKDRGAPGEWWLALHAVRILGLISSESAGLLIAAFMRRMAEDEDDNLQDWLAGYWPALFANKPESVLPALRAVCMDQKLDWYIRVNAMAPVVAAAERKVGEALDESLDWLAELATDEEENWETRFGAGSLLLDFPRERHRLLLESLATRQSGWGVRFAQEDIRKAYEEVTPEPEWRRPLGNPWEFYKPEFISDRQKRWAKEDVDEAVEEEEEFPEEPGVPYLRAAPKIGRNDVCPCGSGKKYKKSCLLGET